MEAKHGRHEDDCNGDRHHAIAQGIEPLEVIASPSIWLNDAGHAVLRMDTSVFSIDSILRAAYKFTGHCHIWLEGAEPTSAHRCLVFFRAKRTSLDLSATVGEFSNELIDQQLRVRLEEQFGGLRTLITAQAFSEGNLLQGHDESQ